ncbi:hypothetical protein EC957_005940 [Mortierella hygrophila]|uniref:F-box domain-containing protein n=1 Tax=Mortierella hygrophila TaxID=979708 RepID=A0A9P6FDC9_9FUNG|nr:hypothetical protein EC957_005940 [Mortierella hygrophila]
MTNSLELPPEIIIKIGFCIPALIEEPSPNTHVALKAFRPQTFFACFLVSRTWYQSLLPVLWYAYCGDSMSRIPNDVIARYSHHFRILRPALVHPGPLHCTHLSVLELDRYETCTYKEHLQLSQLVRENPGLRVLTRTRATSKSMTLESDDFVGLKSLEVLTLGGWKLSDRRLFGILRAVGSKLRILRLHRIYGLLPCDLSPQLELDGFADINSRIDDGSLTLPYLETIETDIFNGGPGNLGIHDLEEFVAGFPRLETLVTGIPASSQTSCLASALRDCCPRLRNLRLDAWGVSEDQLAALVGPISAIGLSSLQLDNICVGKELTSAISQHAATLQHLRLQSAYFQLDLQAVVEMLVECWQLKTFGIQSMYIFNENVAETLKSQLWGQRLERLSLGFETGVNRGEVMDFFHSKSREDSTWTWRHADWKLIAFRAKNADVRAATRVLLEKAFEIVREMGCLHTFEWDGFPFTRTLV